jgi:hypothetical protein
MCSNCGSYDIEVHEEEAKDEMDPLQLALKNAYDAYMRGLYREAMRKNLDLLMKAGVFR